MNSYQKGNQYEREVKKTLESQGWYVEGQHRKISFIPQPPQPPKMIMMGRDIFGCDLIAKKKGEKTLFIQVSTKVNKGKKIRQVSDYPWTWEHDAVQLWLRLDGKRSYEVYEGPDWELLTVCDVPKGVK